MAALGFILLFLIVGGGVVFVAYSGGPSAAREAYLTRGRTFFKIAIPVIFVGAGIAIPAVVIANHNQKVGNNGGLAQENPHGDLKRGKAVFQQTCASCHTLKAVNARGVTGPDLDNIGQVTPQRVLSAIQERWDGGPADAGQPDSGLERGSGCRVRGRRRWTLAASRGVPRGFGAAGPGRCRTAAKRGCPECTFRAHKARSITLSVIKVALCGRNVRSGRTILDWGR